MALAWNQAAYGQHDIAAESERGASGRPVAQGEALQVDAVAQRQRPFFMRAQPDQPSPQVLAHRHVRARLLRGPDDPPASRHVARNQSQVGSPGGDHDRQTQGERQFCSRHPVRVEIVRVEDLEGLASGLQAAHRAERGMEDRAWSPTAADLRQHRVARMQDAHARPDFLHRNPRVRGVPAEQRVRAREVGRRRNDRGLDAAQGQGVQKPVLHEHAVIGLGGVRVERRDDQHMRHGRAPHSPPGDEPPGGCSLAVRASSAPSNVGRGALANARACGSRSSLDGERVEGRD